MMNNCENCGSDLVYMTSDDLGYFTVCFDCGFEFEEDADLNYYDNDD